MGTRAIINVFDRDKHLVTIYRQSDGYLTGQGKEIADVFKGCILVNGITFDRPRDKIVNGMGCAAARLVAYLKRDMGAGNVYINAPDPEATEDYEYALRGNTMVPEMGMTLKVTSFGTTLYDGPLEGFDPEALEAAEDED